MTRRARRAVACAFGAIAFGVGGGAVHPFGPVKQDHGGALFSGAAGMDATALALLQRSCANCHSEQVRWPWYSYVAPASWLVENDVKQARARLNLSRWKEYTAQERETLLSAMGAAVKTELMPPLRYRSLHPEAALSDVERRTLYEWSKREKRRGRAVLSIR